jgi:hypothetical protein
MAIGNETSSSEYVPEIVERQQHEDVSFLSGNLQTGGRQLLIPGRRIYWKAPIPLVTTFILGAASSLGHHFLYETCGGREVVDTSKQEWIIRGDTPLASLTKAFSVSALAMACMLSMHGITFWKKFVTVQTIDTVLATSHNLLSFSNGEMYWKDKTATILALVIW